MMPGMFAAGAMGAGGGGGATPTYFGAGTAAQSTSNISLAWPAGHAAGDTGNLIVATENVAPGVVPGWDPVPGGQLGVGTPLAAGSIMLTLFHRTATSGAEGNAAVPATAGSVTRGQIVVFRGAAASPIEDLATGSGVTSSVVLPAVTTTDVNRMIVAIVGDSFDSNSGTRYSGWTMASLTSITEAVDGGTATNTGVGFGMAYGEKVAAGSTGAGSVTFANGTSNYVAITLALKP